MTVDGSRLRVAAVGSHRGGYSGYLEITGLPGGTWQWRCEHLHTSTSEARNCARLAVRVRMDDWPLMTAALAELAGKVLEVAGGLAQVPLTQAEAETLTRPDAAPVAQGAAGGPEVTDDDVADANSRTLGWNVGAADG